VGSSQGPSAQLQVVAKHRSAHRREVRRGLHVPQLTDVEVGVVVLRPPEEDVAVGLHDPLPGHDTASDRDLGQASGKRRVQPHQRYDAGDAGPNGTGCRCPRDREEYHG